MPHDRLDTVLERAVDDLERTGALKGNESVIASVVPPAGGKGPRVLLEGHRTRPFLRMNSNSYLGLSFQSDVIAAGEAAVKQFGTGPGAVRFISGTWRPHRELEDRLARFHGREAAMIFSSAYATIMGVLPSLITADTAVISDELNHNCIINAMRLATPASKHIYRHLDMDDLHRALDAAAGQARRAIIVTDGIFSMRGDHAPLDTIMELAAGYDKAFEENLLVVADDSHGVGAFGATGRGTEEHVWSEAVDLLVGTLGKAFGVNGGYVAASRTIIAYLRETSPFYIYSNPITPGEAAAARCAVDLVDSPRGRDLLRHLREMTARFETGLVELGFETIPGDHPVVPLMVRDTQRTAALVAYLRDHGVLATGLNHPVVPKGDEEIRFQISADHTMADIEEVHDVLRDFDG